MFLLLEKQKESIKDWESIIFGLVYHDIVYDSFKSNNEEMSALFAKQELIALNVSTNRIQKVEDLIISTKNHIYNSDTDTNIFLDADLSILGSDNKTYSAYSKNVDRKSTRLNSSHVRISYAVFCLKKKKNK